MIIRNKIKKDRIIDLSLFYKAFLAFFYFLVNYAGTVLKIPVRITSADHRPAPLQTILCDFSHSPGVAKITGTPTTIAKDTTIRRRTNTCTIPTIRFFKPNY